MNDPSIDAFFKWSCGLLFLLGGVMTAISRDFGIKQSQIASGWPAFAVGLAMTAGGLALLASCIRDIREKKSQG